MARSHLTLAALATAAVADLDVRQTGPHGSIGAGDFDSARLVGATGDEWVIRVPRTQRAEAQQSADLVAIRALSTGVRSRLSFAVPSYRGQAPIAETRAIVYDYVDGTPLSVGDVLAGTGLPSSVGAAIAAVHMLPTSFVTDAGLTSHTPFEAMRSSASVVDRAAGTGLLPAALLERWEAAIQDSQLWQFQPTVINGSLEAGSFLVGDDRISALLGWHDLQVGDPARDLAWVLGAPTADSVDAVFDAYNAARSTSERSLRHRATLYHELDLARYLLHGTHTKDTEVVDDAIGMMSRLVDTIQLHDERPIASGATEALDLDGVEDLLSATERRHG
ncbi:macrolide 2'-phosphotransferase [Frondihabitans sp. PAMC 28766]|uniref:phosphotransferase n=1 Tax=Frondihabitans sp. PAMC 28766 TaxID=1795630 RepID=UPI00078C71F2|nr:phosphotransferase [Frondihabitans sp. PAMC 28766]AMM20306.1 macrolide 2'-phosphotransferase [Frondihabitans sp. PAMC 28766]